MGRWTRHRIFRHVALVEGVTMLAVFFVAMPITSLAGNPEPVRITGWIHGIAFIACVGMMVIALFDRGWTVMELAPHANTAEREPQGVRP